MKKLLIWLIAIIPLFAQAQKWPTDVVTESRLKQYGDSLAKTLSGGGGVTPTPIADCKRGPTIEKITGITSTQLQALYDGEQVFDIYWRVVQSKDTVRSGSFKPFNNTPIIVYEPLPAGTYKLVFYGKSCKSVKVSAESFKVPKEEGGGILPPDPEPSKGWNIKTVTSGMPWHMNLKITGNQDEVKITDDSNPDVGSNYDLTYLIGNTRYRGVDALKNFSIRPGNALRVIKYKLRKDVSDLNQWADKDSGDYFQKNAGELFSSNTSLAFSTLIFPSDNILDGSGFYRWVNNKFNPDYQFAQWADIADDMSLPKGHIYVENRGEWPISLVMRKGVTHISNRALPWSVDNSEVSRLKDAGVTYNDVPRPNVILGSDHPENFTDQQSIDAANRADISDALWIGETMEGNPFIPGDSQIWRQFYGKLKKRYEERFGERGIPYYICHNYFQFWSGYYALDDRSEGAEAYKKFLALPIDQMPRTDYSPGGSLSGTTLIVEGAYLNAPDNSHQIDRLMQTIFRLNVFKKLGYYGGVFLFADQEYRPNNFTKITYPDGTFYSAGKNPLDPNTIVAYAFISQVYGNVYVDWGAPGKPKDTNKNYKTENFVNNWASGSWFTPGQTEDKGLNGFPHIRDDGEYGGYNGGADFGYFGIKLFYDTYAKVEGGKDQYLKFRVDGGQWITAENSSANDIVNAWFDKRGFVHSRTLNGVEYWFYLNPYGDNSAHKLEVVHPNGSTTTDTVSGIGIHVKKL